MLRFTSVYKVDAVDNALFVINQIDPNIDYIWIKVLNPSFAKQF